MVQWQHPPQVHIPPDLLNFTDDPFLAQLLIRRGITGLERARAFLDPATYHPAPATDLPDIDRAVNRLLEAIQRQEPVCVWGDFDVDGQTSTALLVSTLQQLGATVDYYIPNRLTESHGIKIPALQKKLAEGCQLFLTCDTGIDAHAAVEAARAAGAEVIITDHHDLPDTLPAAHAIINPKRLPPTHPLRELPGVGTAYKVAEALTAAAGQPEAAEQLLDLVALGIVADVARQTGDTRYLLQRGLTALANTQRLGLLALIDNTRLNIDTLTEEHIGFWLAPRLNALGRLGDANLGVELLTTANPSRAKIIAMQLEALNDRRKMLVDQVTVQALSQIEDTPRLAEYNVIVLAAQAWHPGVIGIAASRLVEQFRKPAVLIALRPDGVGRGSARSVPGCDIHQAIKTQANLLNSFGGHPMAAGLSIPPDNLLPFRQALSAALADCHTQTASALAIDAWVELPQISATLLATIQRLAPFGPGNPPVTLACRGLHILEESIFGKTKAHKRLVIEDEAAHLQEVIWWGGAAERSPQGRFDLAFSLSPNDVKGGVQLIWREFQEWEPPVIRPPTEFIDWRQRDPAQVTADLAHLSDGLIWAEGVELPPGFTPHARHDLHPAEALVIWSAPPDSDVFQQLLSTVNPHQVYLVGQPSSFDSFPHFVKQLMGLVKYALTHKEGEVFPERLAAALGHRLSTIRLGLDWLVAQGKLSIYVEEEEVLVLRSANQPPIETVATVEAMLKSHLSETAAYRQFFKGASIAALKKAII